MRTAAIVTTLWLGLLGSSLASWPSPTRTSLPAVINLRATTRPWTESLLA